MSDLVLIPKVTIHPNKVCLYSEPHYFKPKSKYREQEQDGSEIAEINPSFFKSARKNNGFISEHAKRKLFKAIDYMVITSDKKKTFSKLQNKYITYQVVFVTLTLPSTQIHSDKEITNKLFNQLLIELSKYHNVKRYIWRAEKQENGNIHYHLLINQFIEYQELRKRWNRICNKLGYVDSYQARQKEFFKNGFRVSDNLNDKRTIAEQRKAYIIGQKSDWTSPNSTDIHNTRKIKNIRRYVAKYMAKQPDVNLNDINSGSEVPIVNGRLWSCSHDLSNVKGCQVIEDWEISDELERVVTNSKCHFYKDSYFSVYYISASDLAKFGATQLLRLFSDYLIEKFDYHLQLKLA